MGEERKRSRFDIGGPPPDQSRFDRRSRSPVSREHKERSRSPVRSARDSNGDGALSAAEKAKQAAARINASLAAKAASRLTDAPPTRTIQSPSTAPGAADSQSTPASSSTFNQDIYQQDGDYIKDIEINDLRNRYTLTKGSVQKKIKEDTGADVTTRGNYYPDRSMITANNPPLYLHVTSTTKEKLEEAVKIIEDLMAQDLPNLIDERRFQRNRREDSQDGPPPRERRKWPEERIPIDLEPIRGFNIRAQVVGYGGRNVKHIQSETGCRVQIKGRGSGFYENDTQQESDEQMYLHVAGPELAQVENAKAMCIDLLKVIHEDYEAHKSQPPPPQFDGRGGPNQYDGRGGPNRRNYSGSMDGYAAPAAYNAESYAAPAPDPVEQQRQYEAWASYYAQNPEQDPYREYGGYATVMAAYMQPVPAPQPHAMSPPGVSGSVGVPPPPPPPPPPSDAVPPPPPPPPPGV